MQKVNINLEQAWLTIDEAIDYFLDIALDLKALQRLPEPPTDLYIHIVTGDSELDDKVCEAEPDIILESL